MPTETKKIKGSPKDFFLYLGSIIALYASSISLLNLLFNVINIKFPDAIDYSFDPFASSVRLSIATLVIFLPAFIIIARFLQKDLRENPEKSNLGIRKWLTYLTVFISALVAVIDLVVLINTFLGGEITLRFILKVLAVLVVAKWVFVYYFYDLKNKWAEKKKMLKIFTAAVCSLTLALIVFSFMVIGSPKTQRLMRLDGQKTGDLQTIQWQIINYWQQKGKLPAVLDDLNDPISNFSVPKDPEAGKSYSYDVKGAMSFELCADFNLSNSNQTMPATAPRVSYPVKIGAGQNDSWAHDAGKVCFDRIIDSQLYPPVKR